MTEETKNSYNCAQRSEPVFRLYANCIPVKGARRSLICDLQKNRAQFIPNDLFRILNECSDLTLPEIKALYGGAEDETIDQYFDLLLREDYGFWCDEPDRFPPLDMSWDRPERITNAIIDIDRSSRHDFKSVFAQLDELGCQALQIRSYDDLTLPAVEEILQACKGGRLRHLDLIVKFQTAFTEEILLELCMRNQVVSRLLVHSSPADHRVERDKVPFAIRYFEQAVTPTSCGEVAPGYFSITLDHFTEALHFNSCLNRKISIGADGEIRNCPAMKHSCGNIRDVQLTAAVRDESLIQFATVTKDQIAVCRDCEFRYICTDCRAYVSDPGDQYSKPAKCSYNPYSATWE
ncbi:MAG TPA: grasp-with-spasm system SPASM domain peptide maturase [Blastocatellia bacterium]|nr:grasp-with-spasm system SPASM domain peptide maturase [Blastocatellia bacterium]